MVSEIMEKIVAEHGAADYCADTDGQIKTGFFADACGDGRQCGYGTHGGAHGQGNEAADNEQTDDRDSGGSRDSPRLTVLSTRLQRKRRRKKRRLPERSDTW